MRPLMNQRTVFISSLMLDSFSPKG